MVRSVQHHLQSRVMGSCSTLDNHCTLYLWSYRCDQGYNVATVDKKHQVIVDATAYGEEQEHQTLKLALAGFKIVINAWVLIMMCWVMSL